MTANRTAEGLARRKEQQKLRAQRQDVIEKKKLSGAAYYAANKEEINAKARLKYLENRERILEKQRARDAERRAARPPRPPRKPAAQRQQEYRARKRAKDEAAFHAENRLRNRARDPQKVREWKRAEHHRGMKDPVFVVVKRLRTRLHCEIRFRSRKCRKITSVLNLIGCTREELVKWIEGKFKTGMSWKNRTEWHIDHIRPVSSFDMLDLEEQKKCFHFTNLQPLWRAENLAKADKILESLPA